MGTSRRANPTNKRREARILTALQRDARLTNVELTEEVELSPSPRLRRVPALEKPGAIRVIMRASTGLSSVLA
ncbi:winged helix-turn-helix transcriptional regulator [Agrobacterium larrymoorei]|uniref:winged helix-turn-helix transcriptional regulator n=1 Tax=Agrobacterium larrymoorei TaxID=160699 RepID=UPI00286A2D8B|nr:winged helix-turn-helix transcriptional regulator [Agrobacterium larrymoorei]